MKFKHLLWMAFTLLTIVSCKYDDDELWNAVNNHEERIAALETWQKQANENIAALQQLVSTMDYITSVTPITEGGAEIGYHIEFKLSDPINIYHGADGMDAEVNVSLTQDETGNWYWTLNGETLTDEEGNPIRANAIKPSLEIGKDLPEGAIINDEPEGTKPERGAVYLTIDEGKTWTKISGPKGDTGPRGPAGQDGEDGKDGVTGPAGQDNQGITVTMHKEEGYVTFTLENGTTFNVPLESENEIASAGFYILSPDEYEGKADYEGNSPISITVKFSNVFYSYYLYFHYPENAQKEDIANIIAEIVTSSTNESDENNENFITTRATSPKIGVFIDEDDGAEGYCMRVKAQGMTSGETYIIRATLTLNDGTAYVTTRAIRFMEPMKVGDILYSDGSYSTNLISGKTPIGIIFYLSERDEEKRYTNTAEAKALNGNLTGLAMALSDATVPGNINYHNFGSNPSIADQTQSDYNLLWCVGNDPKVDEGQLSNVDKGEFKNETGLTDCLSDDISKAKADISGLANSQYIWSGQGAYGNVENYPAFNGAKLYAEKHNSELPEGTTGWFMPSMGQWMDLLANLGGLSLETSNFKKTDDFFDAINKPSKLINVINAYFEKASTSSKLYVNNNSCDYHTSSEGDNYRGSQVKFSTRTNSLYIAFGDKDAYNTGNGEEAYRVRCILAF